MFAPDADKRGDKNREHNGGFMITKVFAGGNQAGNCPNRCGKNMVLLAHLMPI